MRDFYDHRDYGWLRLMDPHTRQRVNSKTFQFNNPLFFSLKIFIQKETKFNGGGFPHHSQKWSSTSSQLFPILMSFVNPPGIIYVPNSIFHRLINSKSTPYASVDEIKSFNARHRHSQPSIHNLLVSTSTNHTRSWCSTFTANKLTKG